jgi:putative ABC transport system ATP-binding protein
MEPDRNIQAPVHSLIRCEHIQRLYPDGHVAALVEVDLCIGRGEYIAVMGPSGSGKSTLLNLIGGLDKPTAGDIFFDGVSLSQPGQIDMLRINKIGFVFQAFHLLPTLSASENVQIPMFESPLSAAARSRRAALLLAEVGMSHRADHLPTQLSGGERQRVAIARALANDPMVLLADEPTGNLDTVTGQEILNLFGRMHKERNLTIILVTHSPEIAGQAERLIRLRDGKVIEDRKQNGLM